MEDKARIVLSRKSEWMNRARRFKVRIDGADAGRIGNGGTEEFQLTPGHHKISCKVDWCGSREYEVDLRSGETAHLHVESGMKYYRQIVIPFLVVMILNLYFIITRTKQPSYFPYLIMITALPVLVYLFYYLTAARKNYLKISKDLTAGFGK